MGKKSNKICVICNKEYSYCPVCSKDSDKPSWYMIFDGENCYKIYELCVAYRDGKISIEDAQKELKKLDVSGLNDFTSSTKTQIEEILAYRKPETNVTGNKLNKEKNSVLKK